MVISVTFAAFVLSLVIVLVSGPVYETDALLLPPLEEASEGVLSAWMAKLNIPSVVAPMTAGPTTSAILADIIESRHLAEMVVERLGLKEKFEVGTMDEAVAEIRARTNVSVSETGLISLVVGDKDPELAVEMARHYISGLDSLNRNLQFTRAERTRQFIAGQLLKYRERLNGVREEIARFQERYGIVNFEEQVRGAIDVAAELKIRTVIAEIERDLLREFTREDALELLRKEAEFERLNMQLGRIMEGDSAEAVFIPLKLLPGLAQEYASMRRDLEVNDRVYSFLLERYEEAGIDKARNTPTVQVVDEPRLPERPAGMPRWLVVLLVTAAAFVWIGVTVAWWQWFTGRKRPPEEEEAFRQIGELVHRDLERLRNLLRL